MPVERPKLPFFDQHFAEWSNKERDQKRLDPRLGPHEGKIVELMLSGEKPVCEVSEFENVALLFDAADEGKLIYGGIGRGYPKAYFFCQPGQEENMAELIQLFQDLQDDRISATEEYHRTAGRLLGYTNDEIEFFLQHIKAAQKQKEISNPVLPNTGISCLALDIGGVFHADVWEAVVEHYPITHGDAHRLGQTIWDDHGHRESNADAYWSDWEEKIGYKLDRDKITKIIDEKCWADKSVVQIVEQCLQQGIDVCFVSNNTTFFYEQQIKASGLGPYLDRITPYLSHEMGVPKIHPEEGGLVKLAQTRLTNEILFVDDRASSIFKASELGMQTILYKHDPSLPLAQVLKPLLFKDALPTLDLAGLAAELN